LPADFLWVDGPSGPIQGIETLPYITPPAGFPGDMVPGNGVALAGETLTAYADVFNDDDDCTNGPSGDADGKTTTFAYTTADGLNETDTTDPDGGIWTDLYIDDVLLETIDPDGGVTSYVYDGLLDLMEVTDPHGYSTLMAYDYDTYDSSGDLIASVSPPGNVSGANPAAYTTAYGYNSAGQFTSATNPDGASTAFTYNAIGSPLTVTDPLGNETRYGYDAGNALTSATSPGGGVSSYGYDPDGRATSVTDGTGTRTLAYNADGDLTGVSGPGSGSFSYAYNANQAITSRSYPDGTKLTYTYTGAGQVATMTEPTVTATARAAASPRSARAGRRRRAPCGTSIIPSPRSPS
jgi:YD repeat-containing protein